MPSGPLQRSGSRARLYAAGNASASVMATTQPPTSNVLVTNVVNSVSLNRRIEVLVGRVEVVDQRVVAGQASRCWIAFGT